MSSAAVVRTPVQRHDQASQPTTSHESASAGIIIEECFARRLVELTNAQHRAVFVVSVFFFEIPSTSY